MRADVARRPRAAPAGRSGARRSSFSMACSRFSASSSSTSTSSLRVTRKVWCSSTSMPGKSCVQVDGDDVLERHERVGPLSGSAVCVLGALGRPRASTAMNRGSSGGTLTRAKCSLRSSGCAPRPRGSARARRCTGTGAPGRRRAGSAPGRSGGGRTCAAAPAPSAPRSSQCTRAMPSASSAGCTDVGEDRGVPVHQLVRLRADRVEHLARAAGPRPR